MNWKNAIDLNNWTKVLKWKVLNRKWFDCFGKKKIAFRIMCERLTKGIWLKNDRLSFERMVLMMTLELEFMFCEYLTCVFKVYMCLKLKSMRCVYIIAKGLWLWLCDDYFCWKMSWNISCNVVLWLGNQMIWWFCNNALRF